MGEKGLREVNISASQSTEPPGEFYRIGYFSLRDRYDAIASNGAITKMSIRANGRAKELVNCYPSQAPEELYNLKKMKDEIWQSKRCGSNRSGQQALEH